MNNNTINLTEFKEIAKYIFKNNLRLRELGKKPTAIELIGESGLGKTTCVMELGEELGMRVIKLNLAQLEELGD